MKCLICNEFENDNLKRFSDHLRSVHSLSSEQYTINQFHNGVLPTCAQCSGPVRYVSYTFKKYCKDHARLAMMEGGTIGGKATAWNVGLTKETDERIKLQSIQMSGVGNPFFGKTHSIQTKNQISKAKSLQSVDLENRLLERSNEFELITPLEEYSSRQLQYLQFKCVVCKTVQPKTLQAFERGSRCYICHPVSKSNWELEVFNYVKSKCSDTISGDRSAISPKEIDVYVPSKNIGFECHGLYWHSDGSPRGETDKSYSLNKLNLANEKHIKLFQFFDDEWRDKRTICESIIDHRLGVSIYKIGARELKISELSSSEQRLFFDSSHISGYTPSSICYGLINSNGEVLAAISLRKPRQSKYENCLEVARFATRPGYHISGGLNRLMKQAIEYSKKKSISTIMTYVDRRFGDGHGYLACGFIPCGETGIDYWYTDNRYRYDRFKFRATATQSEKEVAIAAGVSKIWGCGSLIFKLHI